MYKKRRGKKRIQSQLKTKGGIKQHEFTRKMRVLREEQKKGERLERWKGI